MLKICKVNWLKANFALIGRRMFGTKPFGSDGEDDTIIGDDLDDPYEAVDFETQMDQHSTQNLTNNNLLYQNELKFIKNYNGL
jgi:hypothetical protein